MKRIVSVLILLCAIVSAYADDLEIWTKAQLIAFSNAVNTGTTYSGQTVKLMADITIVSTPEDEWTPIGIVDDVNKSFQGTFDGQGYTITFNVSSNISVLGLFGYLGENATVQHLKVNGNITNTSTYTTSTAGIAAYNHGTIKECANLAYIVGTTAGGIAGENNGTITNCYNRGEIDAAYGEYEGLYYLGGIAGAFNGTEISNVYASCVITDKDTPDGIVSNNQCESSKIKNSFYYVSLHGVNSDYPIGNVPNTTSPTGLTGNVLDRKLNTADDYSIWTFTADKLPELTCFINKIVRLSDNNDNSAILTSYNGQKCTVELSGRTLYKDGAWNTLCLPFDVEDGDADSEHPAACGGADALTFTGTPLVGAIVMELDTEKEYDEHVTGLDGTTLYLYFTNATRIKAGRPYIVKWDKPADYEGNESNYDVSNPVFNGVTINSTASTEVAFTGGKFVGSYSPFAITADNIEEIIYIGSRSYIGYSNSPRTLRSCRAHFEVPDETGNEAHGRCSVKIDYGDGKEEGTTNIEEMYDVPCTMYDDSWYTLTGVKLDGKPTERGIYIHNGRKEAVR